MIVTTKRDVFPLHMTPFESYMFVDDSPNYPMTFVMEYKLTGEIDRQAFQSAFDQALLRHPMLRSVIRPAKSNRDCWVHAEGYNNQIEWADLHEPIYVNGAGAYINLREEIGVRIWGRNNQDQAVIVAAFHHTATDGIGAYQFFGDLFWYYAKSLGADVAPLPEIDPQDLRKRLNANVSRELLVEKDGEKLSHDTAQPLAPKKDSSQPTGKRFQFPRFLSHTFDKAEYRELRLKAQDDGQTVNDRLLKTLLVTLADWNEANQQNPDGDICINMPLDLRQSEHPPFSAINVVTCSFIRRSNQQIKDREGLSTFLREEAIRVKHSRLKSPFMRLLVQSPVDLRDAETSYASNDCLATAIFSNTGDQSRRFQADLPREKGVVQCGNLRLDDMTAVSPLRDKTRLAVGIFTYKRLLKIGIRTDPFYFSMQDSQELLDLYMHNFRMG